MTHQQAVDTINKSGSELHLLLSDHSCRLLEASNVNCNTHRAGLLLRSNGQPAPSIYAVTLRRGAHGFGFSLRGGTDYDRVPLFVFRIADGGPTYLDGRIQVRIGNCMISLNLVEDCEECVLVGLSMGGKICAVVLRINVPPSFEPD
ncbi:hypothetical protein AHF37_10003 [Paragonimus kellicotti]|nr:hypothetical protein AHF37_10003 [Paragonimus kellicotti]